MVGLRVLIAGALVGLVLGGCTTTQTPIVAGAYDSVGVTAGGGTTTQGVELNVGYKGAKFAVVPVENQYGQMLALKGDQGGERGFSVFAQLGLDATAGTATSVGVKQVVAVGPAAEIWAKNAPVARTNPSQ
jgi:hypothetical protein